MKQPVNELLKGGYNGKVKVYNSKGELIRVEHGNGKIKKVGRR